MLVSIIGVLFIGCSTNNVYVKFAPEEGKEYKVEYTFDTDFIVDDEDKGKVNKFNYDISFKGDYAFETVNENAIIANLKYKNIAIDYNILDVFSFRINENSVKNMEIYNSLINSNSVIETDTNGELITYSVEGKDIVSEDSLIDNVDFNSIINIILSGISAFNNETLVEGTKINFSEKMLKDLEVKYIGEDFKLDDKDINVEVAKVTNKIAVVKVSIDNLKVNDERYNLESEYIIDLEEDFCTEFSTAIDVKNTSISESGTSELGNLIIKMKCEFTEKKMV